MEDYGKLPPQAIELEESVLGALLVDKQAIDMVTFLKPDSFYKDANQIIFTAIRELSQELQPVDILTVVDKLKQSGQLETVGGPYKISTLSTSVVSTANIEFHARIIHEKAILRNLIRYSNELQNLAFDQSNELDEVINFAEKQLSEIINIDGINEPVMLQNELLKIAEQLAELEKKPDQLIGLPSGIVSLDRITGGWEPGDMIIIAARPSIGKTALALQFALNICLKHSVYFVSLEMTTRQLSKRILSSDSEINLHNINNARNLDWVKIDSTLSRFGNSRLYIEDPSSMTAVEFRAKARQMKRKYKVEMIVIDYLQLMKSTKTHDPRLIVQECSRTMKQIAKELGIPVIALSQLNRECEGKIPKMSNLKEAGDIEQDADKILFPVRKEKLDVNIETQAPGLIRVEKNRNGKTGDCPVNISEDITRWEDYYEETRGQKTKVESPF